MSVTTSTPPRRPVSVRRTTTHDCTRPDGLRGPVSILARGRDLLTPESDTAEVLATARLDAQADFGTATIEWITAQPPHPGLAALGGARAFSGFRARVDEAMPNENHSGSVRYQLLDDLPTALMLSGRALRVAGAGLNMTSPSKLPIDICAGWVTGGTLLAGMTDLGPPLTIGPLAPSLESDSDILAWHAFDPLPPYGTRRQRRLDVWQDTGAVQVECFFRDNFADADAVETVVHEYTLHATSIPRHRGLFPVTPTPVPSPTRSVRARSTAPAGSKAPPSKSCAARFEAISSGRAPARISTTTMRSMADIGGLLRLLDAAT